MCTGVRWCVMGSQRLRRQCMHSRCNHSKLACKLKQGASIQYICPSKHFWLQVGLAGLAVSTRNLHGLYDSMTWVCSVHLCEPTENQELGHCSIWTTMACTSRPNMWWRLPAEGMFCGCLRYWRKAIGILLSLFCSRFTECEAWLMPSSQTLQQKPPEKPGHSNVSALQAFKNGQVPRPRLADARWSEWFRMV